MYTDNLVHIVDDHIPDYAYDYNDREEYDNGLFKYF